MKLLQGRAARKPTTPAFRSPLFMQLAGWNLLVLILLFWNIHQVDVQMHAQTLELLRANFAKDESMRAWLSRHGGIFIRSADATGSTQDNYQLLTPIQVLREYYESTSELTGIEGRTFSEAPINPANRASADERFLLERFRGGKAEVIFRVAGAQPRLAMARPILAKQSCSNCHQQPGYQPGKVVGGFLLSVGSEHEHTLEEIGVLVLGHLMLAFIGSIGVSLTKRRVDRVLMEKEGAIAGLEESNRLNDAIVDASLDAIITTDRHGAILAWSHAAQITFGWHEEEVWGAGISDLILYGDLVRADGRGEVVAHSLQVNRLLDVKLVKKGGQPFFAEMSIAQVDDERYCYFIKDVTQRKQIEEKNRQELYSQNVIARILELSTRSQPFQERMRKVLDSILSTPWLSIQSKGAIFLADGDKLTMLVERGLSEGVKQKCSEVKKGTCLCGRAAEEMQPVYAGHVDDRHEISTKGMLPHGHYCLPIVNDSELKGVLVLYLNEGHERNSDEIKFLETVCNTVGNIISKHEYEKELQFNAHYDLLTGLPNRKVIAERVNQAISRYRRDTSRIYAVLFLDLNRFKNINDTLGHAAGDQVLIEFSRRINNELRRSDSVSRLGGDEFVVLLDEANSFEAVCHVADRMHEVTSAPIDINGYDISVTMSIGIAYCASHYNEFDAILRDADTAMYRAKSMSGSATIIFDAAMRERAWSFLEMETELRSAMGEGRLSVFYQPVHSMRRGGYIGAEALVRWFRPDGSAVSPADFVPVAEETGLIFELGEFVLKQACALATRLHQEGLDDFYISVNVSAKQILHRAFVELLDRVLSETLANTRHLRLEITESIFACDLELVNRQLTEIKRRGIHLLIDDFGTGYSSLSYLQNFPFDALKIDKSFVSEIGREGTGSAMVHTIVDLALNLGMDVIVEGVETREQLDYLQGLQCDLMQGFYFARPQAEPEFCRLMLG